MDGRKEGMTPRTFLYGELFSSILGVLLLAFPGMVSCLGLATSSIARASTALAWPCCLLGGVFVVQGLIESQKSILKIQIKLAFCVLVPPSLAVLLLYGGPPPYPSDFRIPLLAQGALLSLPLIPMASALNLHKPTLAWALALGGLGLGTLLNLGLGFIAFIEIGAWV